MIGCYLNYLGNSKRIFANAIEKLDSNVKNIITPTKIETGIDDNYTIQSDIKIKGKRGFFKDDIGNIQLYLKKN